MKESHDPRLHPRAGDRIARVQTNRLGISGVFSRTVLKITPEGEIVYFRRRPNRPCQCSLGEWRSWAKAPLS